MISVGDNMSRLPAAVKRQWIARDETDHAKKDQLAAWREGLSAALSTMSKRASSISAAHVHQKLNQNHREQTLVSRERQVKLAQIRSIGCTVMRRDDEQCYR